MRVSREPQSLPVEEILGFGHRNSGSQRRKCRVGHYVAFQRFDERDTWVLTSTASGPQFIAGFGLQRDAKALHTRWVAGVIEPHARNPNPRIIPLRDQPREEIQFAIWASNGSRIQNPAHFMRITGLRLHDHTQALQLEAVHRISSPGCSVSHAHLSPRQARIVEMTRLVSSGPFTGIDTTPASSAG